VAGRVCQLTLQRARETEPAVEADGSTVLIGDGACERVRAAFGGLPSRAQFECESVRVSRLHAVIVLTGQPLRMRAPPHLFRGRRACRVLGCRLLALERICERPATAHAKLEIYVAEVVLDRFCRDEQRLRYFAVAEAVRRHARDSLLTWR
jgi:hypothetical protein